MKGAGGHARDRFRVAAGVAALGLALASSACSHALAQADSGTQPTALDVGDAGSDAISGDRSSAAMPDNDAGATRAQADPRTQIQPPELREFVAADYPPAALAAGLEGEVVLRLLVDPEGRVIEAEVITPAGLGFDAAASAAALRFQFEPARRDGLPVAARIAYRYEFHLPPPAISEPAPAARTRQQTPLEVTVHGMPEADRRRQSAEAVSVIQTERAQRASADLATVLASEQGVGVRRSGGLGSSLRLSLQGLGDDQVRFFLDGVPLELAGYPFGIANVPVNLVDRVEVYRGVVPVRFGSDALGGAVDLVTERLRREPWLAASYELGSFDTHRVTFGASTTHAPSGFFARTTGFGDYALNDYQVDVEVPDSSGQPGPARVHRFHDAYRALGGSAELGVVDRPWAKRLALRAFVTNYRKEYQHNVVMTVPYGDVTYAETGAGTSLRYEQPLGRGVSLDGTVGYSYGRGHFLDVAQCVYDWFGRCVRERNQPGESDTRPHDQLTWEHAGFGRVQLAWQLSRTHTLRAATAPTYLTRTGDERRQSDPQLRDPLNAQRSLFTLVNGLEYEADLFDDRLENIAFVKHYLRHLDSSDPGAATPTRDMRDNQRFGAGDSLRYRFGRSLYAKASYEWSTRLPRADEVFGDNAFIVANLGLRPESSHNLNLGLTLDARATWAGYLRASALGFLREASQLIVLTSSERVQSYQNVYNARSLGVEASAGWTAPHEYAALDANLTYVDFRNTSDQGTFGNFVGDRIPNRPYLYANATARLQFQHVFAARDALELGWTTRYVHAFFRGWESIGLRASKQIIPAQLVHSVVFGYRLRRAESNLSMSLEVQNLTNDRVFDFYGVQRPGRATYLKTTVEF